MKPSSEAARPETQARELNNGGDGSGGAIAEGWFLQRVVSASLVVVVWPPALAGGERDGRRGVAVAELARGVAVASLARLLPSSTDDPRASAAASLTQWSCKPISHSQCDTPPGMERRGQRCPHAHHTRCARLALGEPTRGTLPPATSLGRGTGRTDLSSQRPIYDKLVYVAPSRPLHEERTPTHHRRACVAYHTSRVSNPAWVQVLGSCGTRPA